MAAQDAERRRRGLYRAWVPSLSLFLVLGGCGHAPARKARLIPPPAPATRDALREEPLSPYGNPESYEVFGQRYYPLKTSRGYVERGVASWYGPGFHRKRTSSGEPYDMYEMTAAHRVLPLPTYVEVTHLETGKKAVVRVNDRGPFKDDRVLDLSFAAARRLGIDGPGTARVEVRALSPGERRGEPAPDPIPVAEHPMPVAPALVARPVATARAQPAPRPETGLEPTARAPAMGGTDRGLFLQVGAFTEAANAERFRARVLAMLAPVLGTGREPAVRIQPAERAERRLYRVQIGPFDGGELAERVGARLSTAGLRSHRVTPAPF